MDINALLWACRRGLKELDLFLLPFAKACYSSLSLDEKNTFSKLLKESDQELLAWFMATEEVKKLEYINLIEKIRDFKVKSFEAL